MESRFSNSSLLGPGRTCLHLCICPRAGGNNLCRSQQSEVKSRGGRQQHEVVLGRSRRYAALPSRSFPASISNWATPPFPALATLSLSSAGRVRRGVQEEAESAYIRQVANNLNTLCEGDGGERVPPEECTCDNVPAMTTKGPYDLDNIFDLLIELFGCGPGGL